MPPNMQSVGNTGDLHRDVHNVLIIMWVSVLAARSTLLFINNCSPSAWCSSPLTSDISLLHVNVNPITGQTSQLLGNFKDSALLRLAGLTGTTAGSIAGPFPWSAGRRKERGNS